MIAVQLLPFESVKFELEKYGCTKVEQIDEELALWMTPWGLAVTVPELGPDKMCPKVAFHEILADIEATRPQQH